jgi:thiamine pyrophosphokinase
MIIGDLDSLRDDVSKYYKERGVHVEEDGDQYSTDFGKSMKVLTNGYGSDRSFLAPPEHSEATQDIIILGTIAGRVDQGLGLLHEIYREYRQHQSSARLWLLSEQNVSFLLGPGKNIISGVDPMVCELMFFGAAMNCANLPRISFLTINYQNKIFTPNIGVLPIYSPAVITTHGLEWDVTSWETRMGGQVSTSNHVKRESVEIETDTVVLFTIEIFNGKGDGGGV